jgi:hypothetical protein
MKWTVRTFVSASLAVGLVGMLLHWRTEKRIAAEEGAAIPMQPAHADEPGFSSGAAPVVSTQDSSRSVGDVAEIDVTRQDSPATPLNPSEMASSYAKSMQTGVFAEEPMPEFAEQFLFPAERSRRVAVAWQAEYFGSPVDQWSSQMEQLLRTSFGQHPLIANVRISIACRSTQCELQFVERTVPVQPEAELGPSSVMLITNVAREVWFRDNFVDWRIVASTPVAAEVAYQRVVLSRRYQ